MLCWIIIEFRSLRTQKGDYKYMYTLRRALRAVSIYARNFPLSDEKSCVNTTTCVS